MPFNSAQSRCSPNKVYHDSFIRTSVKKNEDWALSLGHSYLGLRSSNIHSGIADFFMAGYKLEMTC